MRTNLITHSSSSCLKSCARKYLLRYELGIAREKQDAPLRVGSAYHAAQEMMDLCGSVDYVEGSIRQTYSAVPTWADPYEWAIERETVVALFRGHCEYWAHEQYEVVATEQSFRCSIPRVRGLFSAGKIDRIVRLLDGRLAVQEYKTCSEDLTVTSDYWKRLRIDSQISRYMSAARSLGHAVETVLYDVCRKPTIRAHRATPFESRKYKADGTLYANQRADDETPAEFGQRLAADIASRPEWYFARQEIARLEDDLTEFQREMAAEASELRYRRKHSLWPRNTSACLSWGRPCEFFDLCTAGVVPREDEPLPDGYVYQVPHSELGEGVVVTRPESTQIQTTVR